MTAFESINDFMSMCYVAPMGNTSCHGPYVWAAYGVALVVVVLNGVFIAQRRKRLVALMRQKERRRRQATS